MPLPTSKTIMLQASNLCKTYTTGKEQYHAVRNVDLSIYERDFTVIMGDSGSGNPPCFICLAGSTRSQPEKSSFRDSGLINFLPKNLHAFVPIRSASSIRTAILYRI